jgi:hypothetical protein
MDQQVVSFDLRDRAEIDLSRSRGGLPRLSVSAVDESYEVEFVHTCDSDPLVSMAFFLSLSDRARRAAEELADLMSGDTAGGTVVTDAVGYWRDNADAGV